MNEHKCYLNILFILILIFSCTAIHGSELRKYEIESVRKYRTPEERREAGLGTQMSEWLKFSGLVEVEKQYFENNTVNNRKNRETIDTSVNLQFVSELKITEWFGAELVYESEYNSRSISSKWDEAFLFIEIEKLNIGMELGRISAPFGEFYSHFATGPFVEFGETIRNGFIIDYSFLSNIELSGFIIDSEVEKKNKNTEFDWGAGLEVKNNSESMKFGISYISDLAESDEEFLKEENNYYIDRVSAWNGYLLFGFQNYEITAEYIIANNRFKEFDNNGDKPSAYNIEFAYYLNNNVQIAARYEKSDELRNSLNMQYGVSISWRPMNRINLTADYLHGEYENNFVFDDNKLVLNDRDVFSFQASFEF